jgi:hypothetical protein
VPIHTQEVCYLGGMTMFLFSSGVHRHPLLLYYRPIFEA